jgi:trimethylamine--corrinoid protein Co-methyltransferase
MIEHDFSSTIKFALLSQEDKDNIHTTTLKILEEVGQKVFQKEALTLLMDAGCTVNEDGVVKIPSKLVEKALSSAPASIKIYDREENLAMDLGGNRSYFGTGSDLLYSVDVNGNRHRCVLEDIARAAHVCDALANIDFIMSLAQPSDITPKKSYLQSFATMAENSVKPIVSTAEGLNDFKEIWEICCILRGGEDAVRNKPYTILYAEPISPFKHPVDSLDKLIFCSEKGIPALYTPAPIAGSTAPMTIAGHVAQGLAECFTGLVIHQLKVEGAPFVMGVGPSVLDMRTGTCCYNAPEFYLAYIAAVEMSHYYNIPNWGYGGCSDSHIPDGQATLEAGYMTFLAAMSGSNLNHDVGYLDFGRTGSLELIVITDEIISQVRRLAQGVPVNDETLAFDAICDVGYTGEFLTHEHTAKHVRSVQWQPQLISRSGFEKWEADGSKSFLDRAHQRLEGILKSHSPIELPKEKLGAIQARIDKFEI